MKTHFVCQSMRILGMYNFGTLVNEGKKIERSRGSSSAVICKTSFSCRRCLPLSLALRNLNCEMKHKDIPLIIFYVCKVYSVQFSKKIPVNKTPCIIKISELHFVPKTPFYQLEPTNKTGCFCKKILAANFDNKYYTTPVSNVLLLYKGIWQLKPGKKNKTGK